MQKRIGASAKRGRFPGAGRAFAQILGFAAVLLALAAFAANVSAKSHALDVIFLDAGKADAFVLLTKNSAVVIDAGEDDMGEKLVDFLRERGVSRVDALFITHFDKDHVGGADALIEALPVGAVYESACQKDAKQTRQYREALASQNLVPTVLTENAAFAIDGVQYSIDVANLPCEGNNASNDSSLVIRVQHGQTRFLFAGDAENDRLRELLDEGDLACDVLKVPHHGKRESLSEAFFQAASPAYAVITSDAENPEDETVLNMLSSIDATVYLTRQGTVFCRSDGETLSFSQEAAQ